MQNSTLPTLEPSNLKKLPLKEERQAHLGQIRPAQQNRSRATQSRIAAAAVELIAERGIHDVTPRLVAERAGVSLAATTY